MRCWLLELNKISECHWFICTEDICDISSLINSQQIEQLSLLNVITPSVVKHNFETLIIISIIL